MLTRKDLYPFQELAASELVSMIQDYPGSKFAPRFDPDTGELLPFLCRLRAITGSGKTPILALTANHLKTGVVLWTTNRGAVISQTLSNLKSGGKYSQLVPKSTQVFSISEMSAADWSQVLSSKNQLFILLATVAAFNQDGDSLKIHQKIGAFSRWEMLAGKGPEGRKGPLYIFYDEGHGATEKQFRKLRELHPKAFLLASASSLPEDLADLLSGKNQEEREKSLQERTSVVETQKVVAAGLLKTRLYLVDCNTSKADAIREANCKWLEIKKGLAQYKKIPIACFIVNETSRGVEVWENLVQIGISPTKIAVHLAGARELIQAKKGSSEGLMDTYSGRKAQDRSPEALAASGYTHLIWNLTLREGWDEPLAYVAYLDDRGRSTTDIVQKIGRFVRQPDATPFTDPDLNSAYFYFNISDDAFTDLIAQTQAELENEGYEVISMTRSNRPPASKRVEVRTPKNLETVWPWFGKSISELDQILLDHVPLFADKDLKSTGMLKTRVFEMETLKEEVSLRSEEKRQGGEIITPWDFLSARLGAIDSRIINENGTIFSPDLRNHERMKQEMQHGSAAGANLRNSIPLIKEKLNNKFQLAYMGKHAIHAVQPFNLVSPDVQAGSDAYRSKYKTRTFNNSIHSAYNGFNQFELQVASALDGLNKEWARNPVGKDGFKIPIQELGADTIWFYPDFILWARKTIWLIDPKGKHLVQAAVIDKLLNLTMLRGMKQNMRVAFVLSGSFTFDAQGAISKSGSSGFTLITKVGTKSKALPYEDLKDLVKFFNQN